VAHAVKGGDGKKEEDVNAAAAMPHVVAPVGAPSVHCCGGERSTYCCYGAEESKIGDGEEKKDGDAAAALPQTVAPVRALSVHSCGGAEERKGFDGDAAALRAAAPRRGRGAMDTRLLRFRKWWRPWERQARRRRGFTANGEVTEIVLLCGVASVP
jgi:hypothetical protein